MTTQHDPPPEGDAEAICVWSEVASLLDQLSARAHEDWSPSLEAVRDQAVQAIRALPPSEDGFLVARLEHEIEPARTGATVVCSTIVLAFLERSCAGAGPVLCRMLLDDRLILWLRRDVAWVLGGRWNAADYAEALREAARCECSGVRCVAAEFMAQSGIATESDLDSFLRDPDESVRKLTLRGLFERDRAVATPDTLLRLCSAIQEDRHEKVRELAAFFLGHLRHTPARGGQA